MIGSAYSHILAPISIDHHSSPSSSAYPIHNAMSSGTHPPLSRCHIPTKKRERTAAPLFLVWDAGQSNHPLEHLPVLSHTSATDFRVVPCPRPICTRALVDDARDGDVVTAEECVVDPSWTLKRLGPGTRVAPVSLVRAWGVMRGRMDEGYEFEINTVR